MDSNFAREGHLTNGVRLQNRALIFFCYILVANYESNHATEIFNINKGTTELRFECLCFSQLLELKKHGTKELSTKLRQRCHPAVVQYVNKGNIYICSRVPLIAQS